MCIYIYVCMYACMRSILQPSRHASSLEVLCANRSAYQGANMKPFKKMLVVAVTANHEDCANTISVGSTIPTITQGLINMSQEQHSILHQAAHSTGGRVLKQTICLKATSKQSTPALGFAYTSNAHKIIAHLPFVFSDRSHYLRHFGGPGKSTRECLHADLGLVGCRSRFTRCLPRITLLVCMEVCPKNHTMYDIFMYIRRLLRGVVQRGVGNPVGPGTP